MFLGAIPATCLGARGTIIAGTYRDFAERQETDSIRDCKGLYFLSSMKTIIAFLISFVSSTTSLGQVPDKNEWGEKFNSKGAMLVLKESGRTRINGRTVVSYGLFASGLPKDVDYTLWTRLVGGEPQGVANAFVNKDGLVVNVLADPVHKIAEDPINLKVVAG